MSVCRPTEKEENPVLNAQDLEWCAVHEYPRSYEGAEMCLRRFLALDMGYKGASDPALLLDCEWEKVRMTRLEHIEDSERKTR